MRRWTIPIAVLSMLCMALILPALAVEAEKVEAKKVMVEKPAIPAGQKVFTEAKCQMCHTVYSAGIGEPPAKDAKKEAEEDSGPPDLSLAGTGRTAEWLSLFLQKEEVLNEKKHMITFKGTDKELSVLANWILTLKAPEIETAPATKAAKVEKVAEPEAPADPEAPAAPAADAEKDE